MNFRELYEEGFMIIPNVISEEECNNAVNGIWKFLSKISEGYIFKDNPDTWADKYWPECMGPKGIIQWYHVGHEQFVWDIRQNPKVYDIFTNLWNTKDLLCSFDGINIQRPPEITKKYNNGYDWLHKDQYSSEDKCYQGVIYLEHTTEKDGCLITVPKSQLYHKEFMDKYGKDFNKKDWIKLSDEHKKWHLDKGMEVKRIAAPKGSLILWDSKTIHANATATIDRNNPNKFRYAVYVCMTPRKLATSATIKKKQRYFNEGRVTSHWPHKIKVFPEKPSTFRKSDDIIKVINQQSNVAKEKYKTPILTDIGKKIAGF